MPSRHWTTSPAEFKEGEVIGLVGDNGAGKSTLVKIIAGALSPDSGSLRIDGTEVQLMSPSHARELGIETVYQDLALVDQLWAYANVFLGHEHLHPNRFLRWLGFLDHKRMEADTDEILASLHIDIPGVHRKRVHRMSGGQRQAIAIARAAFWGTGFLLLDEPTASLGTSQTSEVEALIRRMRGRGVPIVLVSHNLRQVFDVADRLFVLRHGQKVFEAEADATSLDEVVAYITGAK